MITKSNKYAEYIKEHPSHVLREQTFYRFPNGYGASVVHGEFTYGLEVAVIKWSEDDDTWDIDYSTPVTSDVVGYIDDLDAVLGEIYELPLDLDTYNKYSVLNDIEQIIDNENTFEGLKRVIAQYFELEVEE